MNILLADDQAQIRSALRLLLEQEPGIVVAGEVANTRDLLSRIQILQADIVLLDWELPGMEAERTLARLRGLCPTAAIVALSGRPEARQAALDAGANAFVSKVDPPDRLLGTVRALVGNQQREGASKRCPGQMTSVESVVEGDLDPDPMPDVLPGDLCDVEIGATRRDSGTGMLNSNERGT